MKLEVVIGMGSVALNSGRCWNKKTEEHISDILEIAELGYEAKVGEELLHEDNNGNRIVLHFKNIGAVNSVREYLDRIETAIKERDEKQQQQ